MTKPKTSNPAVLRWVDEMATLCQPDRIHWCDGSEAEKDTLNEEAVARGVLVRLNQKKLPGCYYHRSSVSDVARSEDRTFICTDSEDEAGPTNNWHDPASMYKKLYGLCAGAMRGRVMYVVPYLMGPPGSIMTKVGLELTDSIYVALSMRIMARMGEVAFEHLGSSEDFNRGLHCMLDVSPERRYIAHFPQDNAIISTASNYGGNVLLGKKCLALRIGSWLAKKEGWLAEHMLILSAESPRGEKTYVTAAFPSSCGKTNFAMLSPPSHFAGWKIRTVGDDIAWMKPLEDGRLHAINPEAGYFGVAPGTNTRTNPNAMETISRDTIYTNVALTSDLDVWWEGKTEEIPKELTDWKGNRWTPDSKEPAAHPNSRFCAPMKNNPAIAPEVDDPKGVPISAIIFGGRRASTIPLVYQAFNWIHGVYIGATMSSETTAAAMGAVGKIRRDPMAMLPFCGYNMGDYFRHWLQMRKRLTVPPRIFSVNWFRRDEHGKFLWPGFGENMRVLKWIVERTRGRADASETPLGWVPGPRDFDLGGMPDFDSTKLGKAQEIGLEEWRREAMAHDDLSLKLYADLPKELIFQREFLVARL
ncbi:MAG TPA: phosphoenolpyruvate carboxykinase (GTP) [Verrucomicrobiae bacterium]|jgi:phosphoenolpyruvate carboxykinase (GTP)